MCVREVCTYGVWHMSVSERCIYVGNVPECEVCLCGVDAWKSMKSNYKIKIYTLVTMKFPIELSKY